MKIAKIFKKREYLLLGLLILFFLLTRFYKISSIPSSVYWDEASIGYNAYSLSVDGKDEWGDFLPIHFRAFGEFKLPVYIYSVVPFVKIFGLNAFSLRFPAVIYSLFSLILIYLIVKKCTGNGIAGLISAFIFSTCPWYFIFSRTGYEATAGVFFLLLGVYFYLYSYVKLIFLPLTFICLTASNYSYNSFRIITPFFVAFILFDFIRRLLIKSFNKKLIYKWIIYFTGSVIFLLISFYPIYRLYKYDYGGIRFGFVSVLNVSPNKIVVVKKLIANYFSEYSYKFLIKDGDAIKRSQMPGFGQIFAITIPFFLLGIYNSLKSKNIGLIFLLFLLVVAPIPSAITKEAPHALRSILMAPLISIFSGLGLMYFSNLFKKYKTKIMIIFSIIFLAYFANYYYQFINSYNYLTEKDWQYAYKAIFLNYKNVLEEKNKVVITSEYGQPYIFTLFYNQYNPELFRESVVHNTPDNWGFLSVLEFGKYKFKKIVENDLTDKSIVFSDIEFNNLRNNLSDIIYLSNGDITLWVYESNK